MEIKKEEYKEFLTEDYLSFKDAAAMLDVREDELRELVKRHQIPTHNVAGAFLRLKKKEVEELKNKWRIERELFPVSQQGTFVHQSTVAHAGLFTKLSDFWYFNDFYILCSVLIVLLLYVILSSQ
jgi:excisionase family DNA binding protein